MTTDNFFKIWCETIDTVHKGRLLKPMEYWYNRPNKTSLIEHEIYPALADKLSLKYSSPYYFIDSVFYAHNTESNTDKVPNIPESSTYLRKIRIALEHENVFDRNLYQELSHLLLLNCELRVIVSYSNNYSTNDVLDELANIILTAPDLNIESESILIILGKRYINGDNIFWEGFVFKENYWVSIGQHLIGTLQKDF